MLTAILLTREVFSIFSASLSITHSTSALYQCRAVAAVVLGNPDSFKSVDPDDYGGRFIPLKGRKYDLQIMGDTHSVQREIKEVTHSFLRKNLCCFDTLLMRFHLHRIHRRLLLELASHSRRRITTMEVTA
jgi:hypothetical protein